MDGKSNQKTQDQPYKEILQELSIILFYLQNRL